MAKMRFQAGLLSLGSLGLFGNVYAVDHGVYVGAAAGQSNWADYDPDHFKDHTDTAYKIFAGVRALDWLGAEVGYADFGKISQTLDIADYSDFSFKRHGVDAFAVAFYSVALVDIFAKAGGLRWDSTTRGSTVAGTRTRHETGTDFAWGAGAQLRLGSLAARLEYERFSMDKAMGPDSIKVISLGMSWTFL